MKVINVKKRDMRRWFETYYEIELDNGEFIFFDKDQTYLAMVESQEKLDKVLEDFAGFWVLEKSVIELFTDVDGKEQRIVDLNDYIINGDFYDNIYELEYYNSYMKIILDVLEDESKYDVQYFGYYYRV